MEGLMDIGGHLELFGHLNVDSMYMFVHISVEEADNGT